MVESDNFSADWSQLLDDMPHEPGVVVSPHAQPATAGATNSGDIPMSSNFASTSKTSHKNSGGSSNSAGTSNNGNNKKRFPWWMLLLLLLVFGGSASAATGYNPVYRVLKVVGIEGRDGKDGADGQNGVDGIDGKVVKQINIVGSASTSSGEDGKDGTDGADGTNGSDGADGTNGADGADGSNACISGLCVSRQTTSPGTQETGNINIDGAILSDSIEAVSDATIGGDATVDGHVAIGSGVAVNGLTQSSDGLNSVTSHDTILANYETVSSFSAGVQYEAVGGVLTLNPSSTISNVISGGTFGVQVASGNAQNFTGNGFGGLSASITHAGTGTVSNGLGVSGAIINSSTGTISTGTGLAGVILNTGTGTITNAYGLRSSVPYNTGTITNNFGVGIGTPSAAGTITNNYGLYINDQETGVGCTNCYNIYSAGATAKNYFAGLVGIGTAPTTSRLAFESSTASTGGLDFGADTLLYRTAAGSLKIEQVGGTNARLYFGNTGVTQHYIGDINGDMIAFSGGNNFLVSGNSGTALSVFAGNGASSTPAATISALGATQPGLAVKGASSQTANLQEWQKSTGSIVASINSLGKLEIQPGGGQYNAGGGADIQANGNVDVLRLYGTGNIAKSLNIDMTGHSSGESIGIAVKANASQTFNLQEWQNSSGTRLSAVDSSGTFKVLPGQTVVNGLTFYDNNFAIGMSGTDLALTTVGGSSNGISFTSSGVGGTPLMRIRGDGTVGIGTSTPGTKLHVKSTADEAVLRIEDSSGTCDLNPDSGSLGTSCSSDERLKTDITDAASVLSEINGLKIHDYTVISSGKQTTGLIAQELLNTNPDMVHLGEDGYYKVDSYNPWKVLKGIQELSASVDDVQSTFTTALEQTNGNLEQTNQTLADLGLRVDDLSTTLQDYADQLADHDQRIQSLEAKVQALEQAN